jgi:hypothetical protein
MQLNRHNGKGYNRLLDDVVSMVWSIWTLSTSSIDPMIIKVDVVADPAEHSLRR